MFSREIEMSSVCSLQILEDGVREEEEEEEW